MEAAEPGARWKSSRAAEGHEEMYTNLYLLVKTRK